MSFLILILFIALPIAEIAVLIKVADTINLLPTIGLIIATAVIGVFLLRQQSFSSLARAQNSLNEGRMPVDSLADAAGLMLSGAFLLTPGLITDAIGFALLVPAVRHGLARALFKRVQRSQNIHVDIFGMDMGMNDDPRKPSKRDEGAGPIIEGEIIEPDPTETGKKPPSGKSPWKK